MNQLPFHNYKKPTINPPPGISNDLPILTKLSEGYKIWHSLLAHLPRLTRFTLGTKIDNLFSDCLELALLAGYAARGEKLTVTQKLSTKLDALKFFLKIAWELQIIDNSQYSTVSAPVAAAGKMIGGWLNMLKTN